MNTEPDKKEMSIRFALDLDDIGYYEARSDFDVFYDEGETQVTEIGKALNAFLRQCGYVRQNDRIFMESVTEDECEYLDSALAEYRNKEE